MTLAYFMHKTCIKCFNICKNMQSVFTASGRETERRMRRNPQSAANPALLLWPATVRRAHFGSVRADILRHSGRRHDFGHRSGGAFFVCGRSDGRRAWHDSVAESGFCRRRRRALPELQTSTSRITNEHFPNYRRTLPEVQTNTSRSTIVHIAKYRRAHS